MFVVNCHEVTGGTEERTFDIAAMCGEFDFAAISPATAYLDSTPAPQPDNHHALV